MLQTKQIPANTCSRALTQRQETGAITYNILLSGRQNTRAVPQAAYFFPWVSELAKRSQIGLYLMCFRKNCHGFFLDFASFFLVLLRWARIDCDFELYFLLRICATNCISGI